MNEPTTEAGPAVPPDVNRTVATPNRTDARRLFRLATALLLLSAPLFVLRRAVPAAAALYPLAGPDAPWIPAAAAGLVLLAAPLAVTGAIVLLLAPGLLLAIALDRASSLEAWVLHGFVLSLFLVSAGAAAIQAVIGGPLTGSAFVASLVAFAAASFGLALLRVRLSSGIRWPFASPHAIPTLAGMLIVPVALLIALAPKFYWEVFNGDGAHAYEAARLLLDRSVPFFDPGSGHIAAFPGTTSFLFAYPASWFIRLFGEIEVSARLPLLLFLPPLAAALILLVNERRRGGLDVPERWLVWLALIVYVVVISFSATYSPYSADIALPATQDTLLVVGFLGYVWSFLRRSWGWTAIFAFITYTSLPNGLLLLAFWLVAWLLVKRPVPRRDTIHGGAILIGTVVMVGLMTRIIGLAGGPVPGGEYGLGALLVRFAFLQVTDWTRLAYVIVPCGILPAIALLFWKRQDAVARAMTLVTAAYFLFAFVQAHAPLHYYIPAMVLPLVVFWRMDPAVGRRRITVLTTTAAAAVLALILSWPAEPGPFTAARAVGRSIDIRFDGYDRFDATTLRAADLLWQLVPYDWNAAVPHASFGGSPLVFQYYAHTRTERDGPAVAILQPPDRPPPAGTRVLADTAAAALYVRDPAAWRRQLALRPATPAGAQIYQEPRGILFRSVPLVGGPMIIDVPEIAKRLGIDVDGLAQRMRVER